ncbi:putative membrane domain protein [Escherichia coli DEC4F]|nr:putative membrane domain protein [Escherichia coli DEC4F]
MDAIDAIRDYSISDIYLYPEQKTINCVVEIENIVFGGYIYTLNNGVTLQNIENSLKDSSCHYVLNGHTEFVNCLRQLTSGKTESVHRTINKTEL